VIVCAGGGYNIRAEHEGEVVARQYQAAGFHAFLLQYRVAPHLPTAALLDAAQCVRLIRMRAEEWQVDPNHLAICGFSAGGHLAAMLGVYAEAGDATAPDPLLHQSSRPDALILCYPYITAYAPRELIFDVVKEPTEAWRQQISVDLHVTGETPPTFLMHTYEDAAVPVEHSLRFANALARHGVSLEVHIYAKGRHGQGLAPDNPYLATWFDLSCRWLAALGWA
jgi:acetyl esterase/lipase